jgi:peptidyl-prolyl cis-trans isomerase D
VPEIINLENKYYLAEINKIEKKDRPFTDPEVQETLNAQLSFKNKIESNTSIIKDISMGAIDSEKFKKFASENQLEIKEYKISNLKQNDIFSEGIIKRIFLTKDGEIDLITNNTLTKNFLVLSINTEYKDLKKDSNEYEQYEAKARLKLINQIYKSHDNNLNEKYKVELNQRTINRVKNSF